MVANEVVAFAVVNALDEDDASVVVAGVGLTCESFEQEVINDVVIRAAIDMAIPTRSVLFFNFIIVKLIRPFRRDILWIIV